MFHRSSLLVVSLLVGLGATGCRTLSALKQRCLTGDTSACESACKKGISGEGGCFHAGNQHREHAALDFAGAEFRLATGFFVRSCDGGYGDGCLLAAESLEAPYSVDPGFSGADAPKTMSDTEIRDREKRLGLACARGSARGCKRLGDVFIGKNAERATKAYVKACDAGQAAPECKAARASEVAEAERWRFACTRRVADDCSHLGDLLYQVDPPRAVRLFVSECQLRGVAELVGGEGQFVRDRIAEAKFAPLPAAISPAVAAAPPAHVFDVISPVADGPVAVAEVIHGFAQMGPELSRCVDLAPGAVPAELDLALVVDATGDVFRTRVGGTGISQAVARCIEGVTEAMSCTPPSSPAKVTLTLRVRAPTPPSNR